MIFASEKENTVLDQSGIDLGNYVTLSRVSVVSAIPAKQVLRLASIDLTHLSL